MDGELARGRWRRVARWTPRAAWAIAVGTMVVLAWRDRLPLVRNNHDVGHADEAAYALQARGLALHGSSRVPYVSVFFRRYDPPIWRHDDHWPPLLGWVMAPFFRWQGIDAAVGRSVCVGIGALLLPLAAAALAALACRRGWAAWLAAAAVLADTLVFQESTRMLSDALMTALLLGFAAAVVAGCRRTRWFWLAGACAAGATLAKGSQILLLGLLPAGAVLVGGWRVLRERRLWGGVAIGVALLVPWWITVAREYGSPLHSTQNHVSAYYGLGGGWDESFYRVHWDQPPPTLRDRFADLSVWKAASRRNAEVFLRSALLGEEATSADWAALGAFGRWVRRTLLCDEPVWQAEGRATRALARPWRTVWHVVALVWGFGALALWPVIRVIRRVGAGTGAFLGLVVLQQALFVILLWSADQIRFTLVLTPLLAVLGLHAVVASCEAVAWGLRSVAKRIGQRFGGVSSLRKVATHWLWLGRTGLSVAAAGVAVVVAVRGHRPLFDWQLGRTDVRAPETPYYPRYHAVAQSLAEAGVGTNAVVMTRNPWELLFYAPDGMRGVGLPYAAPEELLAVARHYGVTHFVYDCERPGLRRFVRNRSEAFRPVAWQPFTVYAIDWNALQ